MNSLNVNALSEQYLGRSLIQNINENEPFIQLKDRILIALFSAFTCLLYYILNRIFFYVCSNTYK